MLEKIRTILRDQCQLDLNRPIIVGVSGGPDSLCLLGALHEAGYQLIAAHFNHNLRPESIQEARSVEETAAQFKIPFAAGSGDVRQLAKEERLAIEEAARMLRYRFLFAQAHRFEAQAVAVGHTADDQVETVLMHFIRGSGLNGLRGMDYRTHLETFDPAIPVVRPLLDVARDETVAYCAAHAMVPHYDPSNESLDYLRNRIRHSLIPTLETYNRGFRQTIWRSVQSLSADHALLNELIELGWANCVNHLTDEYVSFSLPRIRASATGLQRNLIRRAVEHLLPGEETTFAVLERTRQFIDDLTRVRMDLTGGLVMFREGDVLYVAKPQMHLPTDQWPQMPDESDSIALSVPCSVSLSAGWRFLSQEWPVPASAWEHSILNQDRFQVWLDAERLSKTLELRVRRAGDSFEPLGNHGHSQKLSDFFTNVKLPRRARDRWPLLFAGDQLPCAAGT